MSEETTDPAASTPDKSLREQAAAIDWYHTLVLEPGTVTSGWFDTRALPARLPFPTSLEGKRCLDVGTFDGFWAFEMERRGASEVVGLDVLDPLKWDWPARSDPATVEAIGRRKTRGDGFELASRALGSRVRRVERSVYELEPETDGSFDFVYVGSLLLHLRDPIGALMRIRSVCGDQMLLVDAIDPVATLTHPRQPTATLDGVGRPWWWKPNLAALVRMVEAAGFAIAARPSRCYIPSGPGQARTRIKPTALANRSGREAILRERWGDPHGVVLGRTTKDG